MFNLKLNNMKEHIGRKVVVIDETKKSSNVTLHVIKDINKEGIWFEGYDGPTVFALDEDELLFLQGFKAFIHPDEVSIQLVSDVS